MVVPGKSLLEIARMMNETDQEVQLTFTRTHVKVDLGHTCLTARLLDGDYIKYQQILPKEYVSRVLVNRDELICSIDRAQLMAREGNNNIVMQFHDGKLTITANSFVEDNHIIDRKLNVALTRAKKQLVLTGNPELLNHNTVFTQLINHVRQHGLVIDDKPAIM